MNTSSSSTGEAPELWKNPKLFLCPNDHDRDFFVNGGRCHPTVNCTGSANVSHVACHNLGAMSAICQHCHSHMWLEEKTSRSKTNPSFGLCRGHGKVSLPPIPRLPSIIISLLANDSPKAIHFYNILEPSILH